MYVIKWNGSISLPGAGQNNAILFDQEPCRSNLPLAINGKRQNRSTAVDDRWIAILRLVGATGDVRQTTVFCAPFLGRTLVKLQKNYAYNQLFKERTMCALICPIQVSH